LRRRSSFEASIPILLYSFRVNWPEVINLSLREPLQVKLKTKYLRSRPRGNEATGENSSENEGIERV
jgi:hypothetical protein